MPTPPMKTSAEVMEVMEAIESADPEGDDPELEAMRNALRFVLGWEGDAAEFISMHVGDGL